MVLHEVCKHGGPAQVLRNTFNTVELMQAYGLHLWSRFPEAEDTAYHHDKDITGTATKKHMGSSLPMNVHIAAFSFDIEASLRPYPNIEVFGILLREYLQDGFVTSSEPLIVTQPRELMDRQGLSPPWDADTAGSDKLYMFSIG